LLFENDGRLMRQIVWIPIAKLYIERWLVLPIEVEQKWFILLTWFIRLLWNDCRQKIAACREARLNFYFSLYLPPHSPLDPFSERFDNQEWKRKEGNSWTRYLPYWFFVSTS
jgi:hypothetical protein